MHSYLAAYRRYYTSDNWAPKKLEVEVEAPAHLDLTSLRGQGAQAGEALQPEEAEQEGPGLAAPAPPPPQQPAGVCCICMSGRQNQGWSEPYFPMFVLFQSRCLHQAAACPLLALQVLTPR